MPPTSEALEVILLVMVSVRLFIILQHPDDIQPFSKDVVDEGLICEPHVHKYIAGIDSCFQCVTDYFHGSIKLIADCFLTALIVVLRLSIPEEAPIICFLGSAEAIILKAAGIKL